MMGWLQAWVLKPEYLPSWLQGATAIIALAISVWAVWWANAATRRRDRLELRGLAVAIYPEIQILKHRTAKVREGVAETKKQYGTLVGQNVAATLQMVTSIPIPPLMDRNTDRLFLLGERAGPSCIQLVRFLIQYDDFVGQLVSHIATLNAEQWQGAIGQLNDHLALLDVIVAKCEAEVRPIVDAVKG
jgi:hypothetical protein